MRVDFASQAYQARSPQLIDQQCINAFTEPTPKDAKTPVPVYGTPGLTLFSRMGDGPIRGMHIMDNNLFVLSDGDLYEITASEVPLGIPVDATFIGSTTLGGLVSMADNGNQLVMVDGSAGWIYQPGGVNQVSTVTANTGATAIVCNVQGTITSGDTLEIPLDNGATFTTTASGTVGPGDGVSVPLTAALPSQVTAGALVIDTALVLVQITTLAFKPASTVAYFDGYFVFDAAGTRQFFISGINDGTSYSGLDFATASAGSDFVMAVAVYHEQLLIFCQLAHTEVWWDTGNVSFPFQRYDAALIARGIGAPLAMCSEDNTIFWLADDGIFYRLNGFLPQRTSTFAMEHAWAQYPSKWLDSSMFVLDQEGHKFIIINFPSGNATWCYDISTGLWHQRESWGTAWV